MKKESNVPLSRFAPKMILPFGAVVLAVALLAGGVIWRLSQDGFGAVPVGGAADTQAATLSFLSEAGKPLTLASFKGKAVLLNIWATWCPPCRKEMPSLDRLQSIKQSQNFEVVALSIDGGGIDQVRPFFKEIGIKNLKMYFDKPGTSMSALKILGLPTTLLIGADGHELARWVGPKEWDSAPAILEIDDLLSGRRTD
jgi:thiol-disulfide isomerase/thioredoxin